MVLRVAVIGAGAAGLAALRRLAAKPLIFEAVAMEQAAYVGGTWVYTERIGHDEAGLPIHSSMYANLRTNLPKEVMAYQGYPFRESLPSFVTHNEVDSYLNNFTDHFNIRKYIRFNTTVKNVRPIKTEPYVTWEVTSKSHNEEESKVEQYDAVFVCNGHYAIPLVPDIQGQEMFCGKIMHSHNYRHPEDFAGKRVVCLGAASSGQDIILDLAPHASQVYLCHRKATLKSPLPDNVAQKSGICTLHNHTVILEDGEQLQDIDILLLCTGYKFTFPFLSEECDVHIEEERVLSTYKHVIHTKWSSLAFIGLCKTVVPFPQFDCQVRFAMAALDGTMKLPSHEEMEADIESDYQWRLSNGMPHRHAHHMGDLQWPYNDMLATLAGFERIVPAVHLLYNHVHKIRRVALQDYKKLSFKLTGPETFCEITGTEIKEGELGTNGLFTTIV